MFENETNRVLNSYNESVKLLKKLQTLMAPYDYGQPLHDVVFYNCIPRVYSLSSLDYDAHQALNNIVRRHKLDRLPAKLKHINNSEESTIKEHIKTINKITPEVFYYNAFYYGVYNELYYKKPLAQTFNNNTYEDTSAHNSGLYLALDCINLLDNTEPLTYEQRNAISNALKNNKTFIFKGCKVTYYNNGRLIIKFSSADLYNRFKAAADSAINEIKNDLRAQKDTDDSEDIPF